MKVPGILPGAGKYAAVAVTGTGLLTALAVILIFIITATCLKSLFFGLVCAYLFLPLEQLIEKVFFRNRSARLLSLFLAKLTAPLCRLRRAMMRRKNEKTPEEKRKAKENAIAGKSAVLTILILLFLCQFCLFSAVRYAVPYVKEKSTAMVQTMKESKPVRNWIRKADETLAGRQTANDPEQAEQRTARLKEKVESLLKSAAASWGKTIFNSGLNLLDAVFSFLIAAGGFAFDLLMFVFFFFFFLQRLAFYRNSLKENTNGTAGDTGRWLIGCIAKSSWLPDMPKETQKSAAEIMERILQMFNAWMRGYGIIIAVEFVLYSAVFLLFGVPYALPLALLASMTILLPFIGPLAGFLVSVLTVLLFAPAVVPLAGVCAAYLIINGVLEQLFLYPVLVGESIGLTTLETIVAVLFGAVIAGITGMILAVPAAALMKFLIPLVYEVLKKSDKTPTETV